MMNSKHCDEALIALLEAEVREQEQWQIKRVQPAETVSQVGRKGPTLHYRGKGHQGFKLKLLSDKDKS